MRIIAGRNAVLEQAADLLTDESRHTLGVPEKVFFPETQADIVTAVRAACSENRTITIIGAHTGITGGSVPTDGCVAISFSSMNRILAVAPGNTPDTLHLQCEPGITLSDISRFLKAPADWSGQPPSGTLPPADAFFYPPDPTEMTAQLGGTVATNASGARSYRFGPTRAHIEAVSIVLATGETATISRGRYKAVGRTIAFNTDQGTGIRVEISDIPQFTDKNAAGYFLRPEMDLIDLLIGSEGTLAIFSSITVTLRPKPEFLSGLSFFPSWSAAFSFADFLRKEPQVSAVEYFDSSALALLAEHRSGVLKALPDFSQRDTAVLWECIEDAGAAFEVRMERWESELSACGSSFDKTLAGFDDQGRERLRIFRHAVPEIINNTVALNKVKAPLIRKVSTDSAVPLERFRSVFEQQIALIEQTGLRYAIFGHLGDGHLHSNLIPASDHDMKLALEAYARLMTIAIENGGTVSAEHGIGKLKTNYLPLMYGKEAIGAMKQIKNQFDPEARLSPGNLFSVISICSE